MVLLTIAIASPAAAALPPAADREFTPDPASVVRHGPGWRYPQAGWVVVHIEGAPYERGYQHGHLLAAEIVDYIKALAAQRSAKAPREAWRDLRILCDALFLRGYDVEFLEEMKGIADGAAAAGAKFDGRRLDLLDIVTLNSDVEVAFLENALEASGTGVDSRKFAAPQYAQPKARLKEHCSAFAATGPATADGKIVFGHITMTDLGYARHYNIWLDLQPQQGHRVVFQTFPGGIESGLDYYISDSGLIVSETTISQTSFNAAGEPLASRIRRAIQYAESIDQAVDMLGKSSNGLYTNQWLLADLKTNEIAMFELGTRQSKLWRSSRNEWPDGTTGFYWGCNNTRDREVSKETVRDLGGKPANLVRYPRTRDTAWLDFFERHNGRIDEAFAFDVFTTPPLAAFPSCDAKFTTAALAENLQSWALFGPPMGRTWDASPADKQKYPDIQPLIANDWTLLRISAPTLEGTAPEAVDLAVFPKEDEQVEVKFDAQHPFAWRGTLLPKTEADVWLAAGFAEYEHVVAYENAWRAEAKEGQLTRQARDRIDLALFAHQSRWQTAARRIGRDIPLTETRADPARRDWYDLATGKGVLLLATIRKALGNAAADTLFDEFGTKHAGQEVTTADFFRHCEQISDKSLAEQVRELLSGQSGAEHAAGNIWTIYSFEAEPERALIVYGTQRDRAAQREAAELLQRQVARRFSNVVLPIRSDNQVTDDELRTHHLLLVGGAASNRITAGCADSLPVRFSQGSFTVRQATYAHADSAVVAAGDNPHNPRFSVVVFAGLSAKSTWQCVGHIHEDDSEPAPQVLLSPAQGKQQRFRVATETTSVARP